MSDEQERVALAWFREYGTHSRPRTTWEWHAWAIVRAALARYVPGSADEPTTIDARQVGEYVEQDLLAQQRDGAKVDFAATFDRVRCIFEPPVGTPPGRDEQTELRCLIHDALQTVIEAATELHAANPADLGVDELNEARRKLIRARAIAARSAS